MGNKIVELKTEEAKLKERKCEVAKMLILSVLIDRWAGTNFFDQDAHDDEQQEAFAALDDSVISIAEHYGDDILEIEEQMMIVKEELRKWMIAMDDHA